MSDALEQELRAALAAHAAAMRADDAAERLQRIDYGAGLRWRLRRIPLRLPPWPALGGAAAALIAGVEIDRYRRAGSGIAAVTFVFSDGSTVDATVENGWYFAWWPNLNQPTSVRATTRFGLTLSSPMPSAGCRPGSGACSLFAGFQAHPALPVGTGTSPRPRPGLPTATTPTATTPPPTAPTATAPASTPPTQSRGTGRGPS